MDVRDWAIKNGAFTSAPDGKERRPENAQFLHVPSNEELGLEDQALSYIVNKQCERS